MPHKACFIVAATLVAVTATTAATAAPRLKCEYNKLFANDQFVGGAPPKLAGVVTHLSKRFKELSGASADLKQLDDELASIRDRGGAKWDEADRQPYHVYAAYRRVAMDNSGSVAKGSRATMIKCRRAEHYGGDLIAMADILGTSIFRNLAESIVNLPSLHEPMEVYAKFTYALEYQPPGSAGFVAVDDGVSRGLFSAAAKARVQHPDSPKQVVLQAINSYTGLFPGTYRFRITANAELDCDGPGPVCAAASATTTQLAIWMKAGVVTALFGPAAGAVDLILPPWLDPDNLLVGLVVGKLLEDGGRVADTSLLKAVVEYDRVEVPATVPDLRGESKCDAPEALRRRELAMRIKTQTDPDRSKSQKIAGTDPAPFEQVKPNTTVTVTVKTPDNRAYPCKQSVAARMRNVQKGGAP